jgi:hypothetical protein
MAQRLPTLVAALVISTLGVAILPACRPKPKVSPIQVRVFRDLEAPNADQLDHRILEFQATNPHLSHGVPIVVQSIQVQPYQSSLTHVDQDFVPELVILNSAKDAQGNPTLSAELAHATNVCAAFKQCPAEVPAFVPSKVTGPRAEAAGQFLAFLQKP